MAFSSDTTHPGICLDKILVEIPRILDDNEVALAAGAVGYAFRVHFQGEGLSEPQEVQRTRGITSFVLEPLGDFNPNPEKYDRFMDDCIDYIFYGSPVRKSNRTRPGTKGTRLVRGIYSSSGIRLWVHEAYKHRTLSITLDGQVVCTRDFICKDGDLNGAIQDILDSYISIHLQDRR